jgi:hypothetical protein
MNVNRILSEKLLGRPRRERDERIKMDVKKVDCEEGERKELTQNSVHWQLLILPI